MPRPDLKIESLRELSNFLQSTDEVGRFVADLSHCRNEISNGREPPQRRDQVRGQSLARFNSRPPAEVIHGHVEVRGHPDQLVVTRRRSALPRDEPVRLYADLRCKAPLAHRRRALKARANRLLDGCLGHVHAGTNGVAFGAQGRPYSSLQYGVEAMGTNGDTSFARGDLAPSDGRRIAGESRTVGSPE